ncbi:MAG: ChbG/HpnK family deacetylase, partial [Pyrinomonadaceae bacterium]
MKTRPALLLLLTLPALLIAQPAREHAFRQTSPASVSSASHAAPTLAERLGFKATDRVLIVNGDDVGMSHAANAATIDAMENGLMTSATIMVPCPWF